MKRTEYGSVGNGSEGQGNAGGAQEPHSQHGAASDEVPPKNARGAKRHTVRYLSSASGEIKPHFLDAPANDGDDEWLEPVKDEEEGWRPPERKRGAGPPISRKRPALKSGSSLAGTKKSTSDADRGEGGPLSSPPPAISDSQRGLSFSTYASIVTFASGDTDDDDAERTGWKRTASVVTDPGDARGRDVVQRKGGVQMAVFLVLIVTPFVLLQGVLSLLKFLRGGDDDTEEDDLLRANSTELAAEN